MGILMAIHPNSLANLRPRKAVHGVKKQLCWVYLLPEHKERLGSKPSEMIESLIDCGRKYGFTDERLEQAASPQSGILETKKQRVRLTFCLTPDDKEYLGQNPSRKIALLIFVFA